MPVRLKEAIARDLPGYGYAPTAAAAARLAAYLELITAAQPRVRLVGSLDPDTLIRRHLGESLYLGAVLPLERQHLADLGSGAGFPGLALTLAFENLTTTLVESNQKKAAFLQDAIQRLGVESRVTVWPHFLERRPRAAQPSPFTAASLITVRALDKMEAAPDWLRRWLTPQAQVAFWVTAERAAAWRAHPRGWLWEAFHPLPNAATRGILLARALPPGEIVPRGTIPAAEP